MWPYLQVQGLYGRFFASMAAKMAQTCVFAAVLAGNVAHGASTCKYGTKKNDPHRDGYESFLIFSKLAESEFCKVHITLLGESLVQGKSFVESVAGLAFLSYLEVIPHELLVVRMHAVLDDALGALGR